MATVTSTDLRHRIEAAFGAVLPKSAMGGVEHVPGSASDFVVGISGQRFLVTWVRQAWLNAIDNVLARSVRPDIVVAERVPPGSRSALTESGIGWVETSGAAEIATNFLVVSKSGSRVATAKKTDGWTPAVLGVAEAVLVGVKPTVSATHKATKISVGACTNALRFLTDLGVLVTEAGRGPQSGRRVADRNALLDAYVVAAHRLQPALSLSVGVLWRDPVEGLLQIGRRWDAEGVAWAATGLVAASVMAPLATSIGTSDVYIAGETISELELAADRADLRPIDGGRLVLSPFPTVTTQQLTTVVDGLRVAPWPRLVADLRRSGVRGEEAAEHLRENLGGI